VTTMEAKSIFKNVRGSDGPQHGEEPSDPCLRYGRADGLTGASAVSQRAPNKELDIVFYRPPEIAVNSRTVSRPMPRGASEAGSPTGGACTCAETEAERPGRSRPGWQSGTATRS